MDLELGVTREREAGSSRFVYTLQAGELHRTFEGTALKTEPGELLYRVTSMVEGLHRGVGPGRESALKEEIRRRLLALGQDLYRELLPGALRRTIWPLRGDVSRVHVRSKEPGISWEMLSPFDDRSGESSDHLAATCVLTRWLPAHGKPPRKLPAGRILFIDVSEDADGSSRERAALRRLAKRLDVDLTELDRPTAEEIETVLSEGGVGILHASAHGTFETEWADESRLIVNGPRPLRPSDLAGDLRTALRRDRPMAFFNACQLGREGWSLTRIGGWAEGFLDCGCSAFIAPAWTVKATLASLFAVVFYERLGDGEDLGKAALEARRATRMEEPDRPSWLAYEVYGHPAACLQRATDGAGEDG